MLNTYIDQFLSYCAVQKGLADLTLSSYRNDLNHFNQFVTAKKVKIQEINKKTLKQYIVQCSVSGISRSSINRKISSLNQFFKFLISINVITESPAVEIVRPKAEKRLVKFLSDDEVEKLCCLPHDKIKTIVLIKMIYDSGMRVSEVIGIKSSAIEKMLKSDAKVKMLKIIGKGSKERIVPIRDKTLELIKSYLRQLKKKEEYLFPSRSKSGHITREQVGIMIKEAAIMNNIDHGRVSPHVLRHSFATNLCKKNIDLASMQLLLGHSDISTTEIYLHTLHEELFDIVKTSHPMFQKKH